MSTINTKYERNVCILLCVFFAILGGIIIDYGMWRITGSIVLVLSVLFFFCGMYNWIEAKKDTEK